MASMEKRLNDENPMYRFIPKEFLEVVQTIEGMNHTWDGSGWFYAEQKMLTLLSTQHGANIGRGCGTYTKILQMLHKLVSCFLFYKITLHSHKKKIFKEIISHIATYPV